MLMTLGRALKDVDTLPWDHALYVAPRSGWTPDSECMVLDPDAVEDDAEDEPQEARERGLKYALDVSAVRDIVANLRQQGVEPDLALVFRAFCYYYDNDAFLSLK